MQDAYLNLRNKNIWPCHQAYTMHTINERNAYIYLPLVLGVRLVEVEPVAEEDRGGLCNLRPAKRQGKTGSLP